MKVQSDQRSTIHGTPVIKQDRVLNRRNLGLTGNKSILELMTSISHQFAYSNQGKQLIWERASWGGVVVRYE